MVCLRSGTMSSQLCLLDESVSSLAQWSLPHAAAETLVVFDFDLTLSHLPIITTTRGTKARSIRAELRGGASSLEQLQRWHSAGARFAVLTAKVDSAGGVASVVQRLAQLGIERFFRCTPTDANARLDAAARAAHLRLAAVGDVIGSGHNKPEAFWLFVAADPTVAQLKHVVYFDDCADHILSFDAAFRRVRKPRDNQEERDGDNTAAPAPAPAATDGDVLAAIDGAAFAFEDATLCYWPPPPEEGFETMERHSPDAHERVLERCRAQQDRTTDSGATAT